MAPVNRCVQMIPVSGGPPGGDGVGAWPAEKNICHMAYGWLLAVWGHRRQKKLMAYGIWLVAGCWLLCVVMELELAWVWRQKTYGIWHIWLLMLLETVNVTKRFVVTDVTLKRKRGKCA